MFYENQHGIISMLLTEKPNLKSPFWKILFNKVKIAEDEFTSQSLTELTFANYLHFLI